MKNIVEDKSLLTNMLPILTISGFGTGCLSGRGSKSVGQRACCCCCLRWSADGRGFLVISALAESRGKERGRNSEGVTGNSSSEISTLANEPVMVRPLGRCTVVAVGIDTRVEPLQLSSSSTSTSRSSSRLFVFLTLW